MEHLLAGSGEILPLLQQAKRWWRDYGWLTTRLAGGYGAVLLGGNPVAANWFGGTNGNRSRI